jgi:hypothetical protein
MLFCSGLAQDELRIVWNRKKISERVRGEMTVVLLPVASRCKSASSGISPLKPVELPVRAKSRDEIVLPWEEMPLCVLMRS